MTVTIRLPWPPSVNHLYATVNGRRVLTKQGREYHQAVALVCLAERVPCITGSVLLRIDAYPPDMRRRDISNIIKVVEDGLTEGKAWLDDCQIDRLEVNRMQKEAPGHVVVEIGVKGLAQ